jgi:hypothetical protein
MLRAQQTREIAFPMLYSLVYSHKNGNVKQTEGVVVVVRGHQFLGGRRAP